MERRTLKKIGRAKTLKEQIYLRLAKPSLQKVCAGGQQIQKDSGRLLGCSHK